MKRTPLNKRSKKRSSVESRDARWRAAVDKEYGIYCIICGHPSIERDHVWGKQSFPQWRWVRENGRPLCNAGGNNHHGLKSADLDFYIEYMELVNAEGLKEEFIRGVGTIID